MAPHPRFSERTFRPSGPTLFAHVHFLSSDFLFSDLPLFSSLPFPLPLPLPLRLRLPLPLRLLFSSLRFAYLIFSSLLGLFPPLLFHMTILSEV